MAEEIEILKTQVDVLKQKIEVMEKGLGIELDKISKAFYQMGGLLDLLFLETSVLIETLAEKGIITKEDFSKRLEETAKKIEEEQAKAQEKEKSPIIT